MRFHTQPTYQNNYFDSVLGDYNGTDDNGKRIPFIVVPMSWIFNIESPNNEKLALHESLINKYKLAKTDEEKDIVVKSVIDNFGLIGQSFLNISVNYDEVIRRREHNKKSEQKIPNLRFSYLMQTPDYSYEEAEKNNPIIWYYRNSEDIKLRREMKKKDKKAEPNFNQLQHPIITGITMPEKSFIRFLVLSEDGIVNEAFKEYGSQQFEKFCSSAKQIVDTVNSLKTDENISFYGSKFSYTVEKGGSTSLRYLGKYEGELPEVSNLDYNKIPNFGLRFNKKGEQDRDITIAQLNILDKLTENSITYPDYTDWNELRNELPSYMNNNKEETE